MADINVADLKERLDTGETGIVLLDVREDYEREAFNIGGMHIPLGQLPTSLSDLEDFKNQEIILYCRSGMRSGQATAFLRENGFSNARNLTGGMLAWQDAFEA